jgi:hypothetical protein
MRDSGPPLPLGPRGDNMKGPAPRSGTVSHVVQRAPVGRSLVKDVLLAALLLTTACSVAAPPPVPTDTPVDSFPTATATIEPSPTPSYEDLYEPNDSMLKASGPLMPGEEYHGFISAKDDIDYFFLEIETPQIIELSLTDIPPGTDYDLYLVTGEEDVLKDSARSGQEDESIEYTTSSVGVFYVLVLPFENFSPEEPYSLQMDLSPAPLPTGEDTSEPNDNPEQATGPLVLGQKYESYIWDEGDVDVYVFEMDQPGTMQVALTNITAVADYDLFLSNQAGDPLASSTRAVDREIIELFLQAGTYYVTVRPYAGFSQNDPYTIQVNTVQP